jgi:hypothetical protein
MGEKAVTLPLIGKTSKRPRLARAAEPDVYFARLHFTQLMINDRHVLRR